MADGMWAALGVAGSLGLWLGFSLGVEVGARRAARSSKRTVRGR